MLGQRHHPYLEANLPTRASPLGDGFEGSKMAVNASPVAQWTLGKGTRISQLLNEDLQ
jgi:hypothetical protein